jgi:FtsP/CotA-like multicopper oxidase with cupredoxin domain
MPHSFHLHGHQFQVHTVDGRPPPVQLTGWKDTLYLPPGQDVAVVVTFTGRPDPQTAYMFHCHVLRHEAEGMMGQFVVVGPGQTPNLPAGHRHE